MKKFFTIIAFSFLCLSFFSCQEKSVSKPKYVFFFIGDGMGVNQVNATEMYLAQKEGRIGNTALSFSNFPVVSMATTYSKNSPITCSSASGTALASGTKTINYTVGLDSTMSTPLYSVATLAQKKGYKVGICTNVGINHATPASFYAHQPSREMFYRIGTDIFKTGFDFYAGGGFINPINKRDTTAPSLYQIAQDSGYSVIRGNDAFKSLTKMPQKAILIQETEDANITPRIERHDDHYLTLSQITENAIRFLDNDKGFFLMVEGGEIDWAAHANDGGSMIQEVIDFSNTIQLAIDFYNQHPDETLIVISADHETGGISVGNNLQLFQYQKCSKDGLTQRIDMLRKEKKVSWEDIYKLLKENLGFWDKIQISKEDEILLKEEYNRSIKGNDIQMEHTLYSSNEPMAVLAIQILNRMADIRWTTLEHTAGYVPVYVMGVGADNFKGMQDNATIPMNIIKAAYTE